MQHFSGHRFPTGAGFRRGFLEFRLLDAAGKTLGVSGAVNPFGAIVDNNGKVLSTEFPPGDERYDPKFLQPHFGSAANPAVTSQDRVQIYEVRATNEYGQLTTATTRLFGGAKDNRIPPGTPNIFVRKGWAGAGHLMGTHRMGTDAGSSVVDGQQRSHEHHSLSCSAPAIGPATRPGIRR